MPIQYAVFSSLVLHEVNGGFPIFPFDPATGRAGNLCYHYNPSIFIKHLPGNLGFVISSYNDSDSRRICCFETNLDLLAAEPDLLLDSVRMGLSAFGGRPLTILEALDLARKLQPEREETILNPHPDVEGGTLIITYGGIQVNNEGILTRDFTTRTPGFDD